ncbi:MAG: GNAT family N-acetyltransferase [bacterium]
MHARFLRKGEEKKWFDLMGEESDELFTQVADYRPESHIIVEKDDKIVGGMNLIIDEPDLLMLFNPKLVIDSALDLLLRKAIETAKSLKVNEVFSLIHGSNDRFQTIERLLKESNFVFGMKKILYELKSAELSKTNVRSALTYESLSQDNEDDFINIFKAVYQPDIFESDAERCFMDLRKGAMKTKRFYAEDWEIACRSITYVGITMPQLHDERGEIGSNYYLGVIPEERKKGYGRALQRRAVETLHKRGAKMIVGSTEPENTAMIKVFESLGYEFTEYQYFYKYSGVL